MKKVINGKLYDTDTAKSLGDWHNTWDTGDFKYTHEELFRKRTGEFFLHGVGGPMSRYAKSCGTSGWTRGERIQPLTPAAAREWAEEHLSADEYAEIFGMPDEDAGPCKLCINLPADLDARMRERAAELGVPVTTVVIDALKAALE